MAEETTVTSAAEPAVPRSYVAYVERARPEEVEPQLRPIVGEYEEKASYLGRRVYQKVQRGKGATKGKRPLDVLLYYWDGRDGDDYEGWWFGNQLGGSQVWAHCQESGQLPPVSGWKVPWNGDIRPDFAVVPKEDKLMRDMETRLLDLNEEVAQALSEADLALDHVLNSSGLDKGEEVAAALPVQVLAEAETQLAPQVKSVSDLERKVADAHRAALTSDSKTAAAMERHWRDLTGRIRAKKEQLSSEYTKAKALRQKVEHDQAQEAAEEQDAYTLDNFLPEAEAKANAAEDLAEVAQIAYDGIEVLAGLDPSDVALALTETERSAKKAQVALSEARMYVNAKVIDAKSFAPKAKERADAEVGRLRKLLDDLQIKLKPLLAARQDWARKREVQKRVAEMENDMVLAELDVDKAEEAMLLMGAEPNKETLETASNATEVAVGNVETAVRDYEEMRMGASGKDRLELERRIGERGKQALRRLKQLRTKMKEGVERVSADLFLQEGEEKLQAVHDALAALDDATTLAKGALVVVPGAEGKERSLEDVRTWEAQVKGPEAAATAASMAVSMAKMFINMKRLDVKRYTASTAESTIKGLKQLEAKLNTATKHITELRASAAKLRRDVLREEVEVRVAKAMTASEEVREAATIFADDGASPPHLEPEEACEAAARASAKERLAVDAIRDAQKLIVALQLEARDLPEEATALAKLTAQLQMAQASVTGLRKRWGSVGQQLAARQIISDRTESTERGLVKGLLREAQDKARECQERFTEAAKAEQALDGAANDDEKAKKTAAFEKAVQLAQAGASALRTAVAMKRLAARRLSEGRAATAAGEELEELQRVADAASARLPVLRTRSVEAKMALLRSGAAARKAH